uniref:Retrotransposon Copia-like N-terminal domain-containing protein n=1 Tax=Chenopodium quinoa TaxID=63459 RepID=A0A803L377_CHEQI
MGDDGKIDPSSPFYLGSGDQPSNLITHVILKGDNYLAWCRAITLSLKSRRKFGFVYGTISKPSEKKKMLDWETYDELDKEEEKLHQFLIGIDDDKFAQVRTNLLSQQPPATLDRSYQALIQEERSRNIAQSIKSPAAKEEAHVFALPDRGKNFTVRRDKSKLYGKKGGSTGQNAAASSIAASTSTPAPRQASPAPDRAKAAIGANAVGGGWKVYDLDTGDIFVSRAVKFFENEFPFAITRDLDVSGDSSANVNGEQPNNSRVDVNFLDDLEEVLSLNEASLALESVTSSVRSPLAVPNTGRDPAAVSTATPSAATPATPSATTPAARNSPADAALDSSSSTAASNLPFTTDLGDTATALGRGPYEYLLCDRSVAKVTRYTLARASYSTSATSTQNDMQQFSLACIFNISGPKGKTNRSESASQAKFTGRATSNPTKELQPRASESASFTHLKNRNYSSNVVFRIPDEGTNSRRSIVDPLLCN